MSKQEVDRLKSRMLMKSYYVMFRRIVDASRLQSVLLAHYEWIIGLEKQGYVFASGPLFEADGKQGVGMTVFRVASSAEASALAASDPFCESGVATFEIQRWQLNEGRISMHIDFSDQTYSFN